jgi:hypothetical protein
MPAGRFPPPWTADVTPNCFIVRDANGQALSRAIGIRCCQAARARDVRPRGRKDWRQMFTQHTRRGTGSYAPKALGMERSAGIK